MSNSHQMPLLCSGERLIQFATEHLVTEVLIHPQVSTCTLDNIFQLIGWNIT